MLPQKAEKIIYCTRNDLVRFFVFGKAEAPRKRALEKRDVMKKMIDLAGKMDPNGNLFDVYINQDRKKITVRGRIKVNEKVGDMKLAFYYLPLSRKVNIAQQEVFLEKTPRLFPIERDKTPDYIPILRF